MLSPEPLEGLEPEPSEVQAARDRELLESVAYLRGMSNRLIALYENIDVYAITVRAAGASWSTIGDALGITRQAAQQRYAWRADD